MTDPENQKTDWPGHGDLRRADSLRAGEQFYRQDEDDQDAYTRLYLHDTAERHGRQPGLHFVNADVLHGTVKGEFFADHINDGDMVRKVWTGNS